MVTAEQIYQTLGGKPKPSGGFMCHCPAHDDSNPSLSVDTGNNGHPVVKCLAGSCSQAAVIDALQSRGCWEGGKPLTDIERAEMEVLRLKREAEKKARQDQAALSAKRVWEACLPARPEHPYLVKKQVTPEGMLGEIDIDDLSKLIGYVPQSNGQPLQGRILVVPVSVDGKASTLEFIDEHGLKTALAGGRKCGGSWSAGDFPEGEGEGVAIGICEGVGTGLSIKEATGYPVVAALSCNNLLAVAKEYRKRYPKADIVILADLGNGQSKAEEAACAINARLVIPDFGSDRPVWATDFNDLAKLKGSEEVKRQVGLARLAGLALATWPKPQPLVNHQGSEPYPIEALPGIIGAAVQEVVGFVQCPSPLAACSALSVISLVAQGLGDVRRASKLEGPSSVYFLALADSGERKTTIDRFFSKPVYQWEAKAAEAAKPLIQEYEAAKEAWTAERNGILTGIKENAKSGKDTTKLKQNLAALEKKKPEPPRFPRVMFGDTTPEALAFSLGKNWPVGGVLSSEAGIVFGGHAMGKDSVMRNLAMLNSLWGGETLTVDRRSVESFTVRGARLTMGLAVQPETIRTFLDSSKGLARGIGFLARFLIAWPTSTQGHRQFKDAPDHWPQLAKFHRRLGVLLDTPLTYNDLGELAPPILDLSPEAKQLWVAFHDDVEKELLPGHDMAEARDVASKGADNAARLAALFLLFEGGFDCKIGPEHMKAAIRIVTWHLYEARRFMGEIALPTEINNASMLDAWLVGYCRRTGVNEVPTSYTLQNGPSCCRRKNNLDAAIKELESAERVRFRQDGKQKVISVNPALLGGGSHGPS